jgi:phosphonate transport system ATP-binding protein
MISTLTGVSLHYRAGTPVLHTLNLTVQGGEQLALIGPSGAGKTSLLHLLATDLAATSGELVVLGQPISTLSTSARQALRCRIGLIHQTPPLPPRQRVLTAILAGRLGQWSLLRCLRNLLLPTDIEGARAALSRLNLADKLFARCDQLSGGQLQRIGIARVLYQQPQLMLADEPVSSMDPVLANHALAVLCADATERHATLITSLHAVELALKYFPRIIGLRDGHIFFDKPRTEVTEADLDALYANSRIDSPELGSTPMMIDIPRY